MQVAPVIHYSRVPIKKLTGMEVLPNIYAIGIYPNRKRQNLAVIGLHGIGIYKRTLLSNIDEADAALQEHLKTGGSLATFGQSIKGVAAVYTLDHIKCAIHILPDPLAGAFIYRFESAYGTTVSTDLKSLLIFLKYLDVKPKKSLSYLGAVFATGSGGMIESSYEGIGTSKQLEYYEITSAGGVEQKTYPAQSELYGQDWQIEGGIEIIRNEVLDSLHALTAFPGVRKIAHLTGGFDSRLVLGGLLKLGVTDDFAFYCSGHKEHPDRVISGNLATEFDLTMTRASGIEYSRGHASYQESLLAGFAQTAGMMKAPVNQLMRPSNSLIASGGFGGLLRSIYNRNLDHRVSIEREADHVFSNLGFTKEKADSLFSTRFKNEILSQLKFATIEAEALGVRPDAVLDYVFISRRNRYYVSQATLASSNYALRIDPLYSMYSTALSLKVPLEIRNTNQLGYRLLHSLEPKLVDLPFDRPMFDREPRLQWSQPANPKYNDWPAHKIAEPMFTPPYKVTRESIDKAHKLGSNAHLVASFESSVAGIKEILASYETAELKDVFNLRLLNRLLTKEPTNRVLYRKVQNLYAVLLWYGSDSF